MCPNYPETRPKRLFTTFNEIMGLGNDHQWLLTPNEAGNQILCASR